MKKEIFKFLVLLLVAAGAGPAGAAFWSWSTTAANNATADASINWSEGMSPSAVNDSGRAMMAVLAQWRNDNGGSLVTTGGPTAYVLVTSQPFASAADMDGQSIAFIMTPTNGSSPTLNVNGIGAFPLVAANGSPVPSASMLDGHIYHVTFSTANSVFRVHDSFDNAFSIPLGGILWSTAPTAPNANFVAPSGQCISTTTYATYWVQQGSPASGACPGGQFAIIDMRGRVAAALDTLNASAANRLTSTGDGCGVAFTTVGAVCIGGQSATLVTSNLPPYTPSGSLSISSSGTAPRQGTYPGTTVAGVLAQGTNTSGADTASLTISSSGSFIGTAQGGTSAPFSKVQPTIGLIPYLRIL